MLVDIKWALNVRYKFPISLSKIQTHRQLEQLLQIKSLELWMYASLGVR